MGDDQMEKLDKDEIINYESEESKKPVERELTPLEILQNWIKSVKYLPQDVGR